MLFFLSQTFLFPLNGLVALKPFSFGGRVTAFVENLMNVLPRKRTFAHNHIPFQRDQDLPKLLV